MSLDPQPPAGGRDVPFPTPLAVAEAREETVARLTESFALDELSLAQFEGRVANAYDATSLEALAALTGDLPRHAGSASMPALPPLRLDAKLSNLVRGGQVALPKRIEIRAFLGNVELDWRAAEIQPGVTEVDVHNFLGNVEIRLPAYVQVEHQGSAFMGSFECRQPQARPASARAPQTIVRFTGRTFLGAVTVRLE